MTAQSRAKPTKGTERDPLRYRVVTLWGGHSGYELHTHGHLRCKKPHSSAPFQPLKKPLYWLHYGPSNDTQSWVGHSWCCATPIYLHHLPTGYHPLQFSANQTRGRCCCKDKASLQWSTDAAQQLLCTTRQCHCNNSRALLSQAVLASTRLLVAALYFHDGSTQPSGWCGPFGQSVARSPSKSATNWRCSFVNTPDWGVCIPMVLLLKCKQSAPQSVP